MKGTYRRELNSSYFILEEHAMESAQYYQMKMVTENKISHLLPISIHNFNGENQFYYDISGKQTLACIFEKREIEAEQIMQILSGLSKALKELEGYLLEEDHLCLEPEYMYMNVNTEQLFLCFYPFEEADFCQSIQKLSEYLLNRIDHQDEQAVNIAYQLYRLTREEHFAFIQIVEEILKENENSEKKKNEWKEPYIDKAGACETPPCQSSGDRAYEYNVYEHNAYEHNAYEHKAYEHKTLEQKTLEPLEREYENASLQGQTPQNPIKIFKIPAFCFLLFILAGAGYIAYQYGNRPLDSLFSVSAFFGTKDMILAAGAVFVGIAGFFLLFLYKKILEGGKENETEEENIQKQQEREYFAISERAYEKEYDELEDIETEAAERLPRYEETVLLQENRYKEEGILIEKLKRFDKKPPIKIPLSNFPFIIGKLEGAADYVLLDKSVSRMHAKFIKEPNEDMVYLMDLNSKNGTLKNGIPLEANEIVPLTAEDEITFGKVTFTYH
ncbi:MAG: FHA domain-containing protein [Roseburia sp.]|nr:FHA domain-containing protein [Roseburia sp.]MCM1279305.1 FHA domain-containing protein [Robinsoniella sp.]